MAEQWSGEERGAHQPQRMVPEPEAQPELLPPSANSKFGMIAAALVGLALLGGVTYWMNPSSPTPPPQATAITAPAPSQGFSFLQPVAPSDQAAALAGMVMSDADKGAAVKAVQSGAARLAWLAFSDSGTEDGDIVTVAGSNFRQTVPLLKKETRLAVPYTPGAPIKVIATKDGSAPGVTVAVNAGGSVFRLKTMKEGDVIEIAAP